MVLFRQLLNILILFIILFLILFYLNKIHIQQFSSNEFCKSIFSADNESYFEHKKNSNCKGHYGSKINDSVCCGQNSSDEDKIDNENYICPKDYPICLNYIKKIEPNNERLGTCINKKIDTNNKICSGNFEEDTYKDCDEEYPICIDNKDKLGTCIKL